MIINEDDISSVEQYICKHCGSSYEPIEITARKNRYDDEWHIECPQCGCQDFDEILNEETAKDASEAEDSEGSA